MSRSGFTRDQAIARLQKVVELYSPAAFDLDSRFKHATTRDSGYSQTLEAAKVVTAAISELAQVGALESEKKDGFAGAGL